MSGVCVFCGLAGGNPVDIKDTFTSFQHLQSGNAICQSCHNKLNDSFYRRNCWVEDDEGIRTIERTDVLDTLLRPPCPPFRIYLTIMKRKHGWIRIANRWETNQGIYNIAFEEELITVDVKTLENQIVFAKELRESGLSKTELRTSELSLKIIKNLRSRSKGIVKKLREYKSNPLWNVVVSYVE